MTRKSLPHVVIVGAGIGGLTAAIALARYGIPVAVYEQAGALTEIGAGVQISANGSRLLAALGLQEGLLAYGSPLGGKSIRLWSTGQEWSFLGLGPSAEEKYGAPYRAIHRADLQRLLLEGLRALAPDAVHLGCAGLGVRETPSGRVVLEMSGGREVQADVLIGADGIHSAVRRALGVAASSDFTGCMAWRGVVPTDGLPSEIGLDRGIVWVGPKAHVVHYPIRRGSELNFVGVVERDDWTEESWSTEGRLEECRRDYDGWHDHVQAMLGRIDPLFKWGLFLHGALRQWGEGSVSLLGDAAHAALPFLAQGANMAIEDGFVLARCLQAHLDNPVEGLRRYESLRIGRNNRVIEVAAGQLTREHSPLLADPDTAERLITQEWRQDRVHERYDWLYEYDATQLAVA